MVRTYQLMRKLARSYWFACFLVAHVVGLTQIYPYAHLHHVHDEDGSRVVLSVHPVTGHDKVGDIPTDGEHHHAGNHLTLDCYCYHRPLKQTQCQTDFVVFTIESYQSVDVVVAFGQVPKPQSVSESHSVVPPDFRGPPMHG